MSEGNRNRLVISGEIAELDSLRYTPAGIERMELKLRHASQQHEAGTTRQVQCEISALALGELAKEVARLRAGQKVTVAGFLAQRSMRSTQLVLHIEKLKLE